MAEQVERVKPQSNEPSTPRPAPPIAPYKPELDQILEKSGPEHVPLPDWLKK
jgi:hypothetical protein